MTTEAPPVPTPTPDQQIAFQRQLAMQHALQNEGFFRGGHPFPWAPPGAEFWGAVLEARRAKRQLPKIHEGPPNKKAGKVHERIDKETGDATYDYPPAFMFVSADDYVEELDRACLPCDVVVCPSNTVEDSGPGGSKILQASYYVAHAKTGTGMVFRADVPITGGSGMGDPAKKAYTDSLAMFCRGFLAIPRTDAPADEELYQPPPAAPPPGPHGPVMSPSGPVPPFRPPVQLPPRQGYQQPPPGYGPPPQQQRPPQGPPMQQRPPQGPPPGFPPPPYGGGARGVPHGAPQAPGPYPQRGGYPAGGQPGGPPRGMVGQLPARQVPPPPMNGGRPPVHHEPVVHQAQAMLQAQPVPPGHAPQMPQAAPESEPDADLTTPPPPAQETPMRGAKAGEPQTMEQWFQALVDLGWEEGTAMQLVAHKPDEPISTQLKDSIVNGEGMAYFKAPQAVRDAFQGTGYVPQPKLPENQKVMPTGLQLLRFCMKIDKRTPAPAGN
jgi:hypothetical protein